ncbi:NUDIX hydrolase [Robertmurraya kyonggiensis]|uniref:NUDIX domain-containing protein n=1 Tax=Robertmurraya kyonggiensis TaxID=1037680 RepID=A0A4U1D0N8_9BACI|nr:NUDIX domain-containing protein [Robertmurraya kyonggiensis]TKC15308.1 NUDIX domain-containing protein [Robertmurraya kyonggiensis]
MKNIVHIAEITHNQPFCAGVLVTKGDKILITLNPDGLPDEMENTWRVGAVGGGQEPNETILDCAIREAKEEISVDVRIESSPVTFFHDMDLKTVEKIQVKDEIAPYLLERVTNPFPDKPYRAGLPVGPYIYFAIYFANVDNLEEVKAGDDVQGLLLVPATEWDSLNNGYTITELKTKGVEIVHLRTPDESKMVWIPENESLTTVCRLLIQSLT